MSYVPAKRVSSRKRADTREYTARASDTNVVGQQHASGSEAGRRILPRAFWPLDRPSRMSAHCILAFKRNK